MNNNIAVMAQLLRRDLISYKRGFLGKLFDTAFLLFTNLVVFGYFMSQYGLGGSYGPFILIGAIATFGFFDVVGKVYELISDIEGERKISYTLTLPISSRMVFIYIAIYWAINSALITLPLFFVGKLILFEQFDLAKISLVRLIPMFITINLFYGFFSLWLSSILKNLGEVAALWIRVVNPLWMFGAYFYAWSAIYALSPMVAWIDLINPLVYVVEGMRAASLGQEGFIPFWICFCALWIFILIFSSSGIRRLQKRLDCVR